MATSGSKVIAEYTNGEIVGDVSIATDVSNLMHIILCMKDTTKTNQGINDPMPVTFRYMRSQDPRGLHFDPHIYNSYGIIPVTNAKTTYKTTIPINSSIIVNNVLYFFWLSFYYSGGKLYYHYINNKYLDLSVPVTSTKWGGSNKPISVYTPEWNPATDPPSPSYSTSPMGNEIKCIEVDSDNIIIAFIVNFPEFFIRTDPPSPPFGGSKVGFVNFNISTKKFGDVNIDIDAGDYHHLGKLTTNLNYSSLKITALAPPTLPNGYGTYCSELLLLKKPNNKIKVIIPYSNNWRFIGQTQSNTPNDISSNTFLAIGDISLNNQNVLVDLSYVDPANNDHQLTNQPELWNNIGNTISIDGYYTDASNCNIMMGINRYNPPHTSTDYLWFAQITDDASGNNPAKVLNSQSFNTNSKAVNKVQLGKSLNGTPYLFYATNNWLYGFGKNSNGTWQSPVQFDLSLNSRVLNRMNNFITLGTTEYNNLTLYNVFGSTAWGTPPSPSADKIEC